MKYLFSIAVLLFTVLNFSTCTNQDPEPTDEWVAYCENLAGGNVSLQIEGKNWETNCVQSYYVETISTDYEFRYVWIWGYNYDLTYTADTEIDMVWILWTETISGGQTESSYEMLYYDGFFDYTEAISNPDYEGEDIRVFSSDGEGGSDNLTITQRTSDFVKGTLDFDLYEADTNEKLSVSGSFEAVIEN